MLRSNSGCTGGSGGDASLASGKNSDDPQHSAGGLSGTGAGTFFNDHEHTAPAASLMFRDRKISLKEKRDHRVAPKLQYILEVTISNS